MTETTLATLAHEAQTFLKRGEREAEGIGKILVSDNPPDWVRDMCMAAHDGMLPDDWKYEFIGDALTCIEENEGAEDEHDRFSEWFDGQYVNTHERTAWLASSNYRPGFVDEAATEYGGDTSEDVTLSLWLGMLHEARAVLSSIITSLEEEAEARE